MGTCFTSGTKSVKLEEYKKTNIISNPNNKLERCFISKNFNFDKQNISDITFLDDFLKEKTSIDNNIIIECNVLSIEENKLNHLPEYFMNGIKGIKKLNCSKNEFKQIPNIVFNHDSIKVLIFSENKLSEISQSLGNLNNLTELNLSKNNLSKFPNVSNLENLQLVDLSYNCFTIFTKELIALKTHTLIINNNLISEFDSNVILENFEFPGWNSNKILKNLDLSYNKLTVIQPELLKQSSIALLNLKGNKINYYQLKKLEGFENLMERRKLVKDQGFIHNLDVKFDVCGLEI